MLFLCKLDLKEMPKQCLKGTPNLKVLDLSDNKYLQIFSLTNLGFALLCITSDNQLFILLMLFYGFQ
jgi:Leucine-rich repeat (LRR) protein